MSGSNRDYVGVPRPPREYVLTPGVIAAYVDATGDQNPRYRESTLAPPMSAETGP